LYIPLGFYKEKYTIFFHLVERIKIHYRIIYLKTMKFLGILFMEISIFEVPTSKLYKVQLNFTNFSEHVLIEIQKNILIH